VNETCDKSVNDGNKLRVINIGLLQFYEALECQNVKVSHLEWQPPAVQSKEINDLLEKYL